MSAGRAGGSVCRREASKSLGFAFAACMPGQREVVRQVIFAPRGKQHSEKPQQIHEALERLYGPDLRRLELFGHRARPGWTVWGNQVADGDTAAAA